MTKIKHPATRAERIAIDTKKKELEHRRKRKAKESTDEAQT